MTYRPMTPLPYTNYVPMLYIPAMMMQSPSLNNYSMPISLTDSRLQSTRQYTTSSPSLNSYPIPISPTNLQEQSIRQHTTLSSSSTPRSFMTPSPTTPTSIKRSTYPYTSVKNDDQEKDY
ncbi:unnamed protein product [Adineta steineri]|uniref:Uncharacterized protein n=1 Tax=Adineta steineri TaxID=433720 RepID=A0A818XZU0_9BILA|nr:unnamed protein product [Adineta steineri]